MALLPRVGNTERENVTTKRSWRLLAKLFCPQSPQLATGQSIEVMMGIDLHVTAAIVHAFVVTWPPLR